VASATRGAIDFVTSGFHNVGGVEYQRRLAIAIAAIASTGISPERPNMSHLSPLKMAGFQAPIADLL
jgi:hypothetical protein